MPSFTFQEMVANEKGYAPLLVDKASNRIRRDLFHGITVGIDGFEGEHYGGTTSLPNQVCALMTEWGFEFERPKAANSGRTGFKLINRDHVPTVHVKPQRTPRPPKRIIPTEGAGQKQTDSGRGALTAALRETLIAGEPLSAHDAVTRFGGTGGNLRRVVNSMKSEGYRFDEYQGETGKTWLIKGGGPRNGGPKSKAVVKANGNGHRTNNHLPILAGMRADTPATDIPPLPEFGGVVQMVGQILRPDGTIALIFRNEEDETWVTSMEGHSVEA